MVYTHFYIYVHTPSHLEIPHLSCVIYNDVMLYILWIVVPIDKFVIVSSSSCLQIYELSSGFVIYKSTIEIIDVHVACVCKTG